MGIMLNTEGTNMKKGMGNLKDMAGTMDAITKALILTLVNSKDEKSRKDGEKLKSEYFTNVLDKTLEEVHKDKDIERLKRVILMEELDLEIQQRRLNKIKEILATKEGKNE